MNGFKEIDPRDLGENFIEAIGGEWMLITAGDHVSHNTMTASWGGVGVMWGHPVATVVIRPQRYTFRFTERCDTLTLSFLGKERREALAYCGSHSGRDEDKIRNAGLSVEFTDGDTPAIAQAVGVGVPQAVQRRSEGGSVRRPHDSRPLVPRKGFPQGLRAANRAGVC